MAGVTGMFPTEILGEEGNTHRHKKAETSSKGRSKEILQNQGVSGGSGSTERQRGGGKAPGGGGARNRYHLSNGVLTRKRAFSGPNGFVGRLLTFTMSNQSCVQMLQNIAFGSILACRLLMTCFSQKAKESAKCTHYFYTI